MISQVNFWYRWCIYDSLTSYMMLTDILRDAIHTHFVTLIGKWTIVDGWVKHRADKRVKVSKLRYKSFVTSQERTDKRTGLVGRKIIVHLPISVTKWV